MLLNDNSFEQANMNFQPNELGHVPIAKQPNKDISKLFFIISLILSSLSTLILLLILILHFPPKSNKNFIWEYKTVKFYGDDLSRVDQNAFKYNSIYISQNKLDELGKDGWELVSTSLEMETAFPNFGSEQYVTGIRENVRPQCLICIFKRKIEVDEQKRDQSI